MKVIAYKKFDAYYIKYTELIVYPIIVFAANFKALKIMIFMVL